MYIYIYIYVYIYIYIYVYTHSYIVCAESGRTRATAPDVPDGAEGQLLRGRLHPREGGRAIGRGGRGMERERERQWERQRQRETPEAGGRRERARPEGVTAGWAYASDAFQVIADLYFNAEMKQLAKYCGLLVQR